MNGPSSQSPNSTSREIAFLSMRDLTGYFVYDDLCFPALAKRGWQATELAWDLPEIDWSRFAAVVIRSTWDYQRRFDDFLRALKAIEQSGTLLLNSLEIVHWNIDKHYLRELAERGVVIVPTVWLPKVGSRSELLPCFERFQTTELVAKPTVGANADDTFRLRRESEANWSEVERIFRSKPVMIQPFVASIVEDGEYSLFFFGDEFSHAVRKSPKEGDFRVQEEHGGQIRAYHPDEEMLQAAQQAMASLPEAVLYGRVDLVRLADGRWGVIEIELIEPSLYFPYAPESTEKFAEALDRQLRQVKSLT